MHCGAVLLVRCPACGTEAPAAARFCFACGAALTEVARGDATSKPAPEAREDAKAPAASPVPAEGEQAVAAESLGERKHITALFADIAGSTTLLAGMDPEDARELLNTVMAKLSAEVSRLGGTVAKTMGDGLFAVFGAPLAQENHAYRACLAATEMHRVTAAGEAEFAGRIRLRIGLHSGSAIIDQTGEGPGASFDAIGEAVNIAAHLEASAPVGGTLVSGVTRQLAGPAVETERFAQDRLKAEISGTLAWVLTACQRSQHALVISATESKVPFLGREREAAFVRDAIVALADGRGQIVTILGETGVGKTRFLAETLSRLPAERITVISLAGREIERTNPDAILKEIVWSILEPNGAAGPLRSGEEVGARLAEIEPALAEAGRACAWFLSIDQAAHSGAEAEKMRIEALSYIKGLVYHAARRRPLILALDDFQWVDESSQQFIGQLAPIVADNPLLVLVACRDDGRAAPDDLPRRQVLTLSPLSDREAADLLSTCLGEHASVNQVHRRILSQAQNNPRFLVETVRALKEQQVLIGDFGDFVLTDAEWESTIPVNVADIFEARIDRLPAKAKRLLQFVSAYGVDIDDATAAAILQVEIDAVVADFRNVCDAGLLKQVEFIPHATYRVTNPAISAACYRALVRAERRRLHGAICSHLEAAAPGRAGEGSDPRLVGFHAFRAGRFDLAADALLQAGRRAYARLAYGESADLLREALRANDQRAEDDAHRTTTAVDIRLALRDALFPRAAFDEIGRLLEEAVELTTALGDDRRRRVVQRQLASNLLSTGRLAEARPLIEALIAETNDAGAPDELVDARFLMVQILLSQGDFAEAEKLAVGLLDDLASADQVDGASQTVLAALTRMWAIWCAAEQGRFAEVMPLVAEAQEVLSSDDAPFAQILAGIGTGLFWLRYGNVQLAAETLQSVLPLTEMTPNRAWFPSVASPLGLALVRLGRADAALALLQRAIDETPYRHGVGRCLRLIHLGECYLALDRPNEALEAVSDGLRLAEQTREMGANAYALTAQAKCLLSIHRGSEAEFALGKALTLARKLGMAPLIADCEALFSATN